MNRDTDNKNYSCDNILQFNFFSILIYKNTSIEIQNIRLNRFLDTKQNFVALRF